MGPITQKRRMELFQTARRTDRIGQSHRVQQIDVGAEGSVTCDSPVHSLNALRACLRHRRGTLQTLILYRLHSD